MTPQQIEAMKMALEALKWCHGGEPCGTAEAITALEEALAQPEQEPVAWAGVDFDIKTTPPQRPWVGLTFAEICECESEYANVFARNLEAKLKEKNT